MNMEGNRFYLEKGPFRTEEEHWAYIEELVNELHGELVDIGAGYIEGPESDLCNAAALFRREKARQRPRPF